MYTSKDILRTTVISYCENGTKRANFFILYVFDSPALAISTLIEYNEKKWPMSAHMNSCFIYIPRVIFTTIFVKIALNALRPFNTTEWDQLKQNIIIFLLI